MKKIILAITIVVLIIFVLTKTQGQKLELWQTNQETPELPKRTWEIKSIDTMKYSRDAAGAKLNDPTFDQTIEIQIKNIADLGATHVALGTPYDEKFIPYLSRWVAAARRNNLKVWFRGNFSGWEGWFEYPKISRDQHLAMTENFILSHPDLFRDGDIFSPCPECENGGPGDPRHNGDVTGFSGVFSRAELYPRGKCLWLERSRFV